MGFFCRKQPQLITIHSQDFQLQFFFSIKRLYLEHILKSLVYSFCFTVLYILSKSIRSIYVDGLDTILILDVLVKFKSQNNGNKVIISLFFLFMFPQLYFFILALCYWQVMSLNQFYSLSQVLSIFYFCDTITDNNIFWQK